ncbi:heme-binding protein [Bradyrhizobium sp. GCM10027634]|uniref:GlcG/HbpS family heme-binding protein n=1 Tax=unclassified Bradyrhizobium TaxID=2631580 RepID=UPI00188CA96F|nr:MULTISPECIES: heme-binding protein [unclassified Bradyrhizobium]MDN5001862.1 heme-binding protein [Bradyrhizobium sp. WYCCWR 12677]QOZ45839.1 heme-binding protein [Bradyrhizobium sp. CCBAU 53340]
MPKPDAATAKAALAPLTPLYGAPITLDEARLVADAARAEALRHGWPMVIAIADSTGHLVLLYRLDQAQHGSVLVAQQKATTSVDFRRATVAFESALADGGLHLRLLGMTNLTPLEGGLPILREGRVIGAIGVSGMQSTQDAQVAAAGLAAFGA